LDTKNIRKIGILGAGTMGHGIAQCFAVKGYRVGVFDANPEALKSTPDRIRSSLDVFEALGLLGDDTVTRCLENLTLSDRLEAVTESSDLIIECIDENIDLKRRVFARVETATDPRTILCTNTSAISITEIGRGLQSRQRFLGTHFWNPPSIIPCVEVIRSEFTADAVFDTVVALMKTIGKEPIRVHKDVPGFVGNRMQHALQREAMSLVENGIAEPEDVDRVVKFGFGLRLALMGPLERADLGGLDVTYQVQKYLLKYLDNRTEPSQFLEKMVKKGHKGLKTGRGFYAWDRKKAEKAVKERDRLLLALIRLVSERKT